MCKAPQRLSADDFLHQTRLSRRFHQELRQRPRRAGYVVQSHSMLLGFLVFFVMAWGMGAPLVVLTGTNDGRRSFVGYLGADGLLPPLHSVR